MSTEEGEANPDQLTIRVRDQVRDFVGHCTRSELACTVFRRTHFAIIATTVIPFHLCVLPSGMTGPLVQGRVEFVLFSQYAITTWLFAESVYDRRKPSVVMLGGSIGELSHPDFCRNPVEPEHPIHFVVSLDCILTSICVHILLFLSDRRGDFLQDQEDHQDVKSL
jgi:hypothetical protein